MPLIDLRTDLKSLKYGADRPGGGNSGQPYYQVDINTVDSGLSRLRMTRFDDGLIRGGFVGATNASVIDTLRIGKFLTDAPQGPLFITRQIGLQFSNPKLETRKISIGNQGVLGFVNNLINNVSSVLGPTRIYNLGFNTLAQIPVNAFGVHFNRHGLLPTQDDNTKYLAVARSNNQSTSFTGAGLPQSSTNRLVQKAIELLPSQTKTGRVLNLLQSGLSLLGISLPLAQNRQVIDDYIGGPGSVYGIGRTLIRRYDYTSNGVNKQDPQERGKVNYIGTLGLSQQYFSTYNSPLGLGGLNVASLPGFFGGLVNLTRAVNTVGTAGNLRRFNNLDFNNPTKRPSNIDTTTYSTINTRNIPLIVVGNRISSTQEATIKTPVPIRNASYQKYQEIINSRKLREKTYTLDSIQVNAFGIYGNDTEGVVGGVIGEQILPSTSAKPIYSNGNKVLRINTPWNKVTREIRVGSGLQDQINLTPLFKVNAGTIGDGVLIPGVGYRNINDLVKFRIQALDGNNPTSANYMIFRAYLTQLSDNTDANWNSVKYNGRGEDFYIYNGFSRKINISFKVAALSAEEMKPMYQKLNYLMGNVMPDYSADGLMRGPIVRMTIGNWIDGQTGILNNISYTVPQDAPWEIAINEPTGGEKMLILPHIVEVSMTFTPIGSQTKGANLISEKSNTTSHIAQNINDYQYISGSIPTAVTSLNFFR